MSWPTFEDPWWLLLLVPVVLIILFLARAGTPTVPARQHRWAVAARLATLTAIAIPTSKTTPSFRRI